MDTGFGVLKIQAKNIKDSIVWTKNQAMEFTNGKMDGLTKETSKTISEMGLGNFTKAKI
jgi:hypothetical protein